MLRYDLINSYIKKYNFNDYLEIGTWKGESFNNVYIKNKVSVDPDPSCSATFVMTSDDFFRMNTKKFDIIFIDGLHEHQQVDRDIKNSLKILNDGGVIIMHDCHPTSEQMQRHNLTSIQNGENWTGDCWKAFVKNRAELPYEMYVWDNDWGCGVIDTNQKKFSDTSSLPINMEKMTYKDFIEHPEWMNFKKEVV